MRPVSQIRAEIQRIQTIAEKYPPGAPVCGVLGGAEQALLWALGEADAPSGLAQLVAAAPFCDPAVVAEQIEAV